MTNLEMVTELTEIINNLLASGITSCNIHETRTQLDYLFDEFEEVDSAENTENEADEDIVFDVKESKADKQYMRVIENGFPVLIDENEWCENEQI